MSPLETIEVPNVSPSETSPLPPPLIQFETPETTENVFTTEVPVVTKPETPQIIETVNGLSDNTVRFASVEGEFSTLGDYFTTGLPFGNYYAVLINEKASALSFSEEFLIIDDIQMRFESIFYDPVVLFITDIDVTDDYHEILICEYGVNDWIVHTFYRYDGSSIVKLVDFIGTAFFDSHGKLVNLVDYYPAIIADPFITRSYYEYRKDRLEEISVPIIGMTYTFAEEYANFGFYETSDAPTEEFAHYLISSSYNFDS